MRKIMMLAALAIACALSAPATAQELVRVKSAHDPAVTSNRLIEEVKARNFTVLADIDHAAAAAKVDAKLRPTRVIVFGNPRGGTPMMACAQTMGLDLPLRALVFQVEDGAVFVAYEDIARIAARHGAADCAKGPAEAAGKAVAAAVEAATK